MSKQTATVEIPTTPETKVVDRTMADVPAPERKANLIKYLRKRKSVDAGTSVSVTVLVEKLGYTRFDVYGLINGTSGKAGSAPGCLSATGHVKAVLSEEDGLSVHLTAKGVKTDFKERPFVKASVEAKKSEAPAKKVPAKKAGKKADALAAATA